MADPTADNLRSPGGLADTFSLCDPCLSDADYNLLLGKKLTENEHTILQGQISGAAAGVITRGSVAVGDKGGNRAEAQREKKRRMAQMMTDIIEQTRTSMARMVADIEQMEADFSSRDGEEWREKLALNILGEDEIPQRLPGESMDDYRERLEQHLIDEMLNPDGTIKAEYKDHPQYGDYAEWAQKQNNLNKAKALMAEYEDEETTPERKQEILEEMRERGYTEELTYAERVATDKDTEAAAKDNNDEVYDKHLSDGQAANTNSFLKL